MGYTTDFFGQVDINKRLDMETYEFLVKLNDTRRMARKMDKKYGVEGELFVDGKGDFGQDPDDTIIDYNRPPKTQPSLWCQWKPTKDGRHIEWDGNEKFYCSEEWMAYIIDKVLAPKGYVCNGIIEAQGENTEDHWYLIVDDNEVSSETYLEYKELKLIKRTPHKNLPLIINNITTEKGIARYKEKLNSDSKNNGHK